MLQKCYILINIYQSFYQNTERKFSIYVSLIQRITNFTYQQKNSMTFDPLTTKNAKEPKNITAIDISQKNVPFYLKNKKHSYSHSLLTIVRREVTTYFFLFVSTSTFFVLSYIALTFSCFLLISLLISSTLFITTKDMQVPKRSAIKE